jgi:hypothetical protein
MLLEQHDEPVNPSPCCEQPVHEAGITHQPDPTHVVWMHNCNVSTVQPFAGWDHMFACFMQHGLSGLREGNTIVLTPLHWSAVQWGRA